VDFLTVGFLLLIILVSGAIAYLADGLGRKIGKKRLSFGRMRPKHVAALSVVMTGILVSLATILLVGLFSADVRTWLLDGRRAIQQVRLLEGDVEKLRKEGSDLQKDNLELELQNKQRESRSIALQARIDRQGKAIAEQQREVARLTGAVATAQSRINTLNQRLATNDRQLRERQAELRKTQADLAALRAETQRIRLDRETAVGQFNEVNRRNADLTDENSRLEREQRNLNSELTRLKSETESLESQKQQATEALSEAQTKLAESEAELRNLTSELNRVRADYRLAQIFTESVSSTFNSARKSPLTFKMGEEIARYRVEANLTRPAAAQALENFLSLARTQAAIRGAKAQGPFEAASIVDHEDPVLQRPITAQEIKDSLIDQLTGISNPQVLVGYSSLNAFAGEPVSIEPAIFGNPVVYMAGQVLAEARIDGARPAADVFDQISLVLRTQVSERARADRMLPRSGTDQPFGAVTPEEILDLVERIRDLDRRVTLRITADTETRAADMLKLRFVVR